MQTSFEDLMQARYSILWHTSVGFGPTQDGQPRATGAANAVTAAMTNSDEGAADVCPSKESFT